MGTTSINLSLEKVINGTAWVTLCSKTVKFQNANPLPAYTSQVVTLNHEGIENLLFRTKCGTKIGVPNQVETLSNGAIKLTFIQVWQNAFPSGQVLLQASLKNGAAPVTIHSVHTDCCCKFEISPTV